MSIFSICIHFVCSCGKRFLYFSYSCNFALKIVKADTIIRDNIRGIAPLSFVFAVIHSVISLGVERLILCSLQHSIDCVDKQNYTLQDVITAFWMEKNAVKFCKQK